MAAGRGKRRTGTGRGCRASEARHQRHSRGARVHRCASVVQRRKGALFAGSELRPAEGHHADSVGEGTRRHRGPRPIGGVRPRDPHARSELEDVSAQGYWVSARERAQWVSANGPRSHASLAVNEVRGGVPRRVWFSPAVRWASILGSGRSRRIHRDPHALLHSPRNVRLARDVTKRVTAERQQTRFVSKLQRRDRAPREYRARSVDGA